MTSELCLGYSQYPWLWSRAVRDSVEILERRLRVFRIAAPGRTLRGFTIVAKVDYQDPISIRPVVCTELDLVKPEVVLVARHEVTGPTRIRHLAMLDDDGVFLGGMDLIGGVAAEKGDTYRPKMTISFDLWGTTR